MKFLDLHGLTLILLRLVMLNIGLKFYLLFERVLALVINISDIKVVIYSSN